MADTKVAAIIFGELGCRDSRIGKRVKIHRAEGEAGLEQKKKQGKPPVLFGTEPMV